VNFKFEIRRSRKVRSTNYEIRSSRKVRSTKYEVRRKFEVRNTKFEENVGSTKLGDFFDHSPIDRITRRR
jgi:hypothetical protein